LLKNWRAAMRLPLLLTAVIALPLAIPVWIYFPLGQFYAGMWVGATLGMIVWVRDDPPDYIARWKRGADGEAQTAKALRTLECDGWRIFHDRGADRGNLDHVVIGPAGVFLLETKNLSGVIRFEPSGLSIHHEHAPRNDFIYSRLDATVRGAALRLNRRIREVTRLRPWVQAVVVIWGDFPQGLAEGDQVVYIAGEKLAEWLAARPSKLSARDVSLLGLAVDAELVAPPAAAIAS
jgi:hypothetical protein